MIAFIRVQWLLRRYARIEVESKLGLVLVLHFDLLFIIVWQIVSLFRVKVLTRIVKSNKWKAKSIQKSNLYVEIKI